MRGKGICGPGTCWNCASGGGGVHLPPCIGSCGGSCRSFSCWCWRRSQGECGELALRIRRVAERGLNEGGGGVLEDIGSAGGWGGCDAQADGGIVGQEGRPEEAQRRWPISFIQGPSLHSWEGTSFLSWKAAAASFSLWRAVLGARHRRGEARCHVRENNERRRFISRVALINLLPILTSSSGVLLLDVGGASGNSTSL
eukprot:evm.model.scf_1388EXC.2 EVM.evm.TU.scf_1388EXC.2   scf_1388EXC:11445-12041(+)